MSFRTLVVTLHLFAAEARALLAFERGRAPAFSLAVRAWLHSLAWRWRRMRLLSWADHGRLLQAEHACLQAGLAYRAETDEQRAPWHLPSRFISLPAADLPPHPLLDPATLSAVAAHCLGEKPLALEALTWWLSPSSAPWRGQGLPLVGEARANDQAAGTAPAVGRVAVCLHLYYTELWPELWGQLCMLPEPFDLLLTVPDFALTPRLQHIVADCPRARFLLSPNRGRDVLPWLRLLQQGAFSGYEVVCKLHGKNSPHTTQAQRWRQDSVGSIVGDRGNAAALLAEMRADPSVGVLGPLATAVLPAHDAWQHQNQRHLRFLTARLNRGSDGAAAAGAAQPFFAGTMFWFRPAALQPLVRMDLQPGDFAPEMGQTDGTLAHALERFLAHVAERAGYRMAAWNPAARRVAPLAATPSGSSPATSLITGNP